MIDVLQDGAIFRTAGGKTEDTCISIQRLKSEIDVTRVLNQFSIGATEAFLSLFIDISVIGIFITHLIIYFSASGSYDPKETKQYFLYFHSIRLSILFQTDNTFVIELVMEEEKAPSQKVLGQFIRAFLLPTLIGKLFILYFGLNYSEYPGEGYGIGLVISILFTVMMLGLFLWKYRHSEDL